MADSPSPIQQEGIGLLLNSITAQHSDVWGNSLWEEFEEWGPKKIFTKPMKAIVESIHDLPTVAKRTLVDSIIMNWNKHHNLKVLKDSINTLVYYGACGPAEYFFMIGMFNFIKLSKPSFLNYIVIESSNFRDYTLRYYKSNMGPYGDSFGCVRFIMHSLKEQPGLQVAMSPNLFCELGNTEINSKEESVAIMQKIFSEQFPLEKSPWVEAEWTAKTGVCEEVFMYGFIVFFLEEIDFTNEPDYY